jgi:CelD/BcsL family acetyltransferase involved in cellulose biosynthesis
VRALSLSDLDAESARFDAAVLESSDVDRFCSSTDWILPAAEALMPRREPFLRAGEHGWLALMAAEHPVGMVLEPLEAMWALGCPIIGRDEEKAAREIVAAIRREQPRALLLLSGLVQGSPRFVATARAFNPLYLLRLGPITRRHCADLRGGFDAFLARRSANVRRGLQRALKRARELGLTFEPVLVAEGGADTAYDRILAVEARSWKAAEGVSILHSEMLGFYRLMLRRLARRGAVRLQFARLGGEDVAYILGGLFGDTYRGLQFSYDRAHEVLSLGNLCQYHQVRALCDEGIALYDLGAEVDYKRRWGERIHETVSLVALPR